LGINRENIGHRRWQKNVPILSAYDGEASPEQLLE
jgi:hypothetical protein